MTPVEDQLRSIFRDRESDITEAHIRIDCTSSGPVRASAEPANRWRVAMPALVAAAMLGVIILGVAIASAVGADKPAPPVSTPAPSASTPPPADPDAAYRYWLSETVIPADGADVVAVLVRSGGPDLGSYGVGAMVDRWDGHQWQPYRYAATCYELCVGTLEPVEAEGSGIGIGYGGASQGAGSAQPVQLDGLEPGSYRLRKTFQIGTERTTAGTPESTVDAIGQFTVVDGDAPIVPLGAADDTQLLIYQPLLPAAGGTLAFARRGLPPAASWLPAAVTIEKWTADRWEPSATLAVRASPTDPAAAQVNVAPSAPGAYRIVDRSTTTQRQAVFWVTDTLPN